jgi:acetyl-CoA carboxylase biotin carboxyl carrier protein
MEFKEIQDLLKLVNRTDLTEVEIKKEGFTIRIRRKSADSNVVYAAPPPQQPQAQPPLQLLPEEKAPKAQAPSAKPAVELPQEESAENLFTFRSPMIGTFYRSSSPEDPPFVKVGDLVQKGQVLCIIEAMKLFNEIESEIEGKIVKIQVENQQPVEYDQPLFLIEPANA